MPRPGDSNSKCLHWGSPRCIASSGRFFSSLPPSVPFFFSKLVSQNNVICQNTFIKHNLTLRPNMKPDYVGINGGAQNPPSSTQPPHKTLGM